MHKFTVTHRLYPPVTITIPIKWDMNPYGTSNWAHHFMSLRWVNIDIKPILLKLLLKDFTYYNIYKRRPNRYYRTKTADHATAIRVHCLLYIKEKMLSVADEETIALIDRIIIYDIYFLQSMKHYRHGHNHGLIVDTTLISVYLYNKQFSNLISIQNIIQRSIDTLRCMFNEHTGITKEHSIAYQSFNFNLFLKLYTLLITNEQLHSEIDIESVRKFYNTVKEGSKQLLSMGMRATTYFPIGDSGDIPHFETLGAIFDCKPSDVPHYAAAYRKKTPFALFSEGFCFFRSVLATEKKFTLLNYIFKYFIPKSNIDLVFLCGWHSAAHKQNDELSFMLDYKGINFFDDAGYNGFLNGYEVQCLQNEHHHSTITVDEAQWSAKHKPDWRNSINGYCNNHFCYMIAEHFRIDGYRVARKIYIRRDSVLIEDYIDVLLNKASRHRFILGNDISIENTQIIDNNLQKILLTKYNIIMEMYCIGENIVISNDSISAISDNNKDLSTRMTLDFLCQPSIENRISFFISFDKTDPHQFLRWLSLKRARILEQTSFKTSHFQ